MCDAIYCQYTVIVICPKEAIFIEAPAGEHQSSCGKSTLLITSLESPRGVPADAPRLLFPLPPIFTIAIFLPSFSKDIDNTHDSAGSVWLTLTATGDFNTLDVISEQISEGDPARIP